MSGDFRFDFSKKSKGKKAVKPVPENLDENAKEYRERARAERKRFVDATDTEFWLCLCFPSPAEMARWRERFGFGENHRIYACRDIEKLLAPYKPAKSSAVAFGAGVGFGGGLGSRRRRLTRSPMSSTPMIWRRIVSPSSPPCTGRWFRLAVPGSSWSRPIPNTGSPSRSRCETTRILSLPSMVFANSEINTSMVWP